MFILTLVNICWRLLGVWLVNNVTHSTLHIEYLHHDQLPHSTHAYSGVKQSVKIYPSVCPLVSLFVSQLQNAFNLGLHLPSYGSVGEKILSSFLVGSIVSHLWLSRQLHIIISVQCYLLCLPVEKYTNVCTCVCAWITIQIQAIAALAMVNYHECYIHVYSIATGYIEQSI